MAEFRFRIPSHWNLNSHHLAAVHVVGMEGVPAPCKVRVNREQSGPAVLQIARNQKESGYVNVIYPHPTRGEMLLNTGTLPESEQTYDLLKELARGTINRLRDQLSIWEEGGLQISDGIYQGTSEVIGKLAGVILCPDAAQQDRLAEEVIDQGVELICQLSGQFGRQIAEYRLKLPELPPIWLAYSASKSAIPNESEIFKGFSFRRIGDSLFETTALIKQISRSSQSVIVGPWLDASAGGLPPEFLEIENFQSRQKFLLSRLRQFLESAPDQVKMIHLLAGLNGIGHRDLSYPQQLQMSIDLLQLADEALVETPLLVSFDFPWGERLAGAVGGIHPLQIADNLIRQGAPIAFFGLEINLDFWPGGSVVRDPLQWIDLVDIWSQFGIPLVICLRFPSAGLPAAADCPVDRRVNQQRSNLTEQQRLKMLEIVLPMLLARPAVQGFLFMQTSDQDDLRFEHGGLVDCQGIRKPGFAVIDQLQEWLSLQTRPASGTAATK